MSGNIFKISTSWNLNNCEQKLENTISLCYSSESASVDDIVQFETCIELTKSQEATCSVDITLSEAASYLISKLSLVSEARILEIYGPNDEYFTTCRADFIDEFEGCAVYMAETTVTPSNQVHIKFARMKHVDRIWIYGIRLQLIESPTKVIPNLANINFNNVNDRLKDSSFPLSDKAERCKTFLQSYGLNENKNGADPQILLKMLEAQCLTQFKPIGETGRNMSKCLANLVPFLSKKEDLTQSASLPVKNGTGLGYNGTTVNNSFEMLELKKYIDSKFSELESNVLLKIERLERKQNEQFENILFILNNIQGESKK